MISFVLKVLPLIFLFALSSTAYSQVYDEFNVDSVNAKMFKMYEKKNWKGMISYGETALREGVESMLLRKRLGIAYYFEKNYFKAIANFEKAISYGFSDYETAEYIYYCYFLTGRDTDKDYIFYNLPGGMRRKLKPLENNFIDNVKVIFEKGFSNDEDKNSGIDLYNGTNDFGEQNIDKGNFSFSAGLSQMPLRFMKINYAYTYRKNSYDKIIQSGNSPKFPDSYDRNINQFYNSINFRIATGLSFTPSAHYISMSDSTYYFEKYSAGPFPPVQKSENFTENFVLSGSLAKYYSVFRLAINGSFSYLNKVHQTQYGLSVKAFPLQKISLYSLSDLALHNENGITNLIFKQSFGGRIKKVSYEAGVAFGKIKNFNDNNGYSVYFDPVEISYLISAKLNYNFSYTLSGWLDFNYQNRERDISFHNVSLNSIGFQKVKYNLTTVAAGMLFNF